MDSPRFHAAAPIRQDVLSAADDARLLEALRILAPGLISLWRAACERREGALEGELQALEAASGFVRA